MSSSPYHPDLAPDRLRLAAVRLDVKYEQIDTGVDHVAAAIESRPGYIFVETGGPGLIAEQCGHFGAPQRAEGLRQLATDQAGADQCDALQLAPTSAQAAAAATLSRL